MNDQLTEDRAKKSFAERINERQVFTGRDILKVVSFAGLGCLMMNAAQSTEVTRKTVNTMSEGVSGVFERIFPFLDHQNARIAGREVLDVAFMVLPFITAVGAGKWMENRNINLPIVSDLLKAVARHDKGASPA